MTLIPFPMPRRDIRKIHMGGVDGVERRDTAEAGSGCADPESDGSHGLHLLEAAPSALIGRSRKHGPTADSCGATRTGGDMAPARSVPDWADRQAGMATAEYAIATLAAVAFAGLLAVVLGSDEVRGMLVSLIRSALTLG